MAIGNSNQYYYKGRGPFDVRATVSNLADLTNITTWEKYGNYVYNGMVVGVSYDTTITNRGVYVFNDPTVSGSFKAPDVTNIDNWHKLCELDELDSLVERISALEAYDHVTEADITAQVAALKSEIEKDYATKAYVDEAISNVEVDTSDLVSTSQFNTELAKKADKSTTLAGYGITDVYTKAEVDTAIVNAKLEGEEVDLSNYVTINQLTEVANELEEHVAATDGLTTKVTNIEDTVTSHTTSISNLNSTMTTVQTTLTNKVNTSQYNTEKANFATKSEVNAKNAKLVDSDEIDVSEDGTSLTIKPDSISLEKLNTTGFKLVLDGGTAASV